MNHTDARDAGRRKENASPSRQSPPACSGRTLRVECGQQTRNLSDTPCRVPSRRASAAGLVGARHCRARPTGSGPRRFIRRRRRSEDARGPLERKVDKAPRMSRLRRRSALAGCESHRLGTRRETPRPRSHGNARSDDSSAQPCSSLRALHGAPAAACQDPRSPDASPQRGKGPAGWVFGYGGAVAENACGRGVPAPRQAQAGKPECMKETRAWS